MSVTKDVVLVVLPVLVAQVGEGVREHIRAKRESVCSHGRPGGRLCPHCSAVPR